jgi:hypothetical protein
MYLFVVVNLVYRNVFKVLGEQHMRKTCMHALSQNWLSNAVIISRDDDHTIGPSIHVVYCWQRQAPQLQQNRQQTDQFFIARKVATT